MQENSLRRVIDDANVSMSEKIVHSAFSCAKKRVQGATLKKLVVQGGVGRWGRGGFGARPQLSVKKQPLFVIVSMQKLQECKNTIKLFNLCTPPCLGLLYT